MLIPNKFSGYQKDGIRLYFFNNPPSPPPAPSPVTSQTQTTELPEWARPYAKDVLAKGEALTDINKNPYQTYNAERLAGFNPMQQQAFQQAQNMQTSAQLGTGTGIASLAGLGALNTKYQTGQFSNQFQSPDAYQPSQFGMLSAQAPNLQNYQMGDAERVQAQQQGVPIMSAAQTNYRPEIQAFQMGPAERAAAQQVGASTIDAAQTNYRPDIQAFQMGPAERISAQQVGTPLMDAAQTGFRPDLQTFQMGPAERVRTQSFANPYAAEQYMSPYMQNVVEAQQREAQRSADIAGTQRAARATQAGAFGGSRQAIENAEAARNLATQKGDIQATGLQAAYQQAQGQFNAEQQARLQAQQANQQAGLQVGGQNLQAALGVQQLGAQAGLQTSLANLSSAQQANVQNQAAQLQAQGLNAQQAMQAALANQQAGLQVGQQNLASQQAAQQLGTQTGLQTSLANLSSAQQANVQNAANALQAQGMNQQAAMQAALANQQAGLQVGQQNLASQQAAQQLGTQTGLQTSLANLSSAQQANVQNQAAQLQTQGMNAQQAMQAALANQQAGLQVGGQNLQAALGIQQLGAGQNLQAQLANQQAFQQAQTAGEQSRQFGAGQGLQAASLGAQYGQSAQQLGEQSRQYGAGLGMQGLQTGLQAAGQLGQLGQTQYGQQMGINQLQNQYGSQQQAQQQQANEIAYQNFLNQQNYPYKQLGFMSDILRGMPLGQQSTASMYQAPPSMVGQIAGLGAGAYGLSQLLKAEGGLTKSYADGGSVESESNISSIVSKLSDEQLNQAERAAQARGDVAQLQIIQAEKAMRASERNGMAGAFNQLPEEQQQMMAKGGIIAFADEGLVTDPMGTGASEIMATPKEGGRSILDLITNEPEWKTQARREREAAKVAAPAKQAQNDQKLLEEAAKKMAETEKPQQKPQLKATSTRASTSQPPVEAPKQDGIADIYEKFLKTNKEDLDAYRAEQMAEREDQKRRMEEQKKNLGMEALTRFGFQMAANASTPGATLFGSAGKASPVVADVLEQGKRLEMAALENMAKLKRDDAQFNMAVKRNDMKSALEYANVMRQDKKDQQMLELERKKLAQMGSYYAQAGTTSIQKIADDLMRADPSLDRKKALENASMISGYSFRSEGAANTKRMEQLQKIEKEYAIDAFLPPDSDLFKRRQEEKRRRMAELGGGSTTSTIPEGVTIKKLGS